MAGFKTICTPSGRPRAAPCSCGFVPGLDHTHLLPFVMPSILECPSPPGQILRPGRIQLPRPLLWAGQEGSSDTQAGDRRSCSFCPP